MYQFYVSQSQNKPGLQPQISPDGGHYKIEDMEKQFFVPSDQQKTKLKTLESQNAQQGLSNKILRSLKEP